MASNNPDQERVADILAQLFDIECRLKARSLADQKKYMNEERDKVMTLIRNVLGNLGQIPILGDIFSRITSTVMKFFGFDPFEWYYFEEYDHNARFANRAFSNPSLFDALAQAGQILMEKQSPHLKRVSDHFDKEVTSAGDVDRVADVIIGFCKCLPFARNGFGLPINVNDIKQLLVDSIKLLLTSEVSEERFERLYSNPLVLESGEICWVKYKFVSNTYIQVKDCNCKEKRVNLDVTIWYYWFPSESDFRQALRRIERDD